MKIGVLLYVSFSCIAPFSLISSSPAPLLFQTTAASLLENASHNIRYLISPTTTSSLFTKHIVVENNDSSLPTVLNDYDVPRLNHFHFIKIKPEYVRKRYELDERPTRLDEFRFYRNFNNFLKLLNYKLKRESNPYYRHFPFHHRNPFKYYETDFYHPYLPSSYGVPSFVRRFNRQNNLVDYMRGNRGYYPEKTFTPLDSVSDAASPAANRATQFSKHNFVTSPDVSHVIASKLENRSVITPNNSTDVTRTESLGYVTQSQLIGEEYFFVDDKREIQNSSHEVSTLNLNEDESDEMFPSNIKPMQFEHITTLKNDFHADNRVYYERIPQNNNLSWYVYANCSREKCQFTNSTNETDLMNEGWIMHNCTSYGCIEMYPRTESIQKFIGLILLVFSVCVLKIVVFLLVFYYCRRIKMSKERSVDGQDLLSEDETTFDVQPDNKEKGEDLSMETPFKNGANLTADGKFISTKHNAGDDSHIPLKNSIRHSSVHHAVDLAKDNSKIWIPPKVQKADRLQSGGDVLHRKKALEKKTPNAAKRIRNWNASGLEEQMKSYKYGNGGEKADKIWDDTTPFIESADNRELLLMNLDEEIDTRESPKWEALLKQGSASFISLNLGDGDHSKK